MEYAILFFSGIIGGGIAGLLGLGGGIFYIIVLPFVFIWFGIPAEESTAFVVANSLIGIAFASGTSIFKEFKSIKTYYKESLLIAIPAVIISLLSTAFIVHGPWFSKEIFSGFVIILMIFILIQMQWKQSHKKDITVTNHTIKTRPGILSGGLAGFISALSGMGGGIIIIPILQIVFHQSVRKAKLISLVMIFLSSSFISIQNLFSNPEYQITQMKSIGYILPAVALPLVLGVFIGSPLGVRWSHKMNDKRLNQAFILFVFLVLLEKISGLLFS